MLQDKGLFSIQISIYRLESAKLHMILQIQP